MENALIPKDFDWEIYLLYNEDLKRSNIDTKTKAELHYIEHGFKENRTYTDKNLLGFDWKFYLPAYSQHKEDLIIANFFKNKKGNFLDLGANDGITISNTYKLLNYGWNGVYIEASPLTYNKLKENLNSYNNVQTLNFCLSNKKGKHKFYHNISFLDENVFTEKKDLLSTIDVDLYEKNKDIGIFKEMEIECVRYEDIESNIIYESFEMISIDIEGMDYEILTQLDLKKYKTELIIIEYNNIIEIKNKIINYCNEFGLKKILLDNGINIILTK